MQKMLGGGRILWKCLHRHFSHKMFPHGHCVWAPQERFSTKGNRGVPLLQSILVISDLYMSLLRVNVQASEAQ